MSKSLPKIETILPADLKELGFMREIAELVQEYYPQDGEEQCFRAFTWALNRFAPESPSTAASLREFMEKGLAYLTRPPTPPPMGWIPGMPPGYNGPPGPIISGPPKKTTPPGHGPGG